jgi:hypothetical protein
MRTSIVICLAAFLAGGCAMGVKHDYQAPLELGVATPASVAVASLDHRPYVVSGQKGENFVGLSRGGFGNPFDITTQSGNALASDISTAIVASLKAKGVDARALALKPTVSAEQAVTALRDVGMQKSVLLRLVEWKGDTMVNVGLSYDLDLRVLDKGGNVLASKVLQGKENLGSGDPFSPGGGNQVLPRFRRMMEILFQDPVVSKALQL